MTINKYQGRTKEEAIEKARQEMGEGAVVLNVKEIKPKGMFKVFKDSTYEVTMAMEEKEKFTAQIQPNVSPVKQTEGISLAADERIAIPRPEASVIKQEVSAPERSQITVEPKKEMQPFCSAFMRMPPASVGFAP